MAAYYGVPDKYDEICQWYDGYRFGDTDIFNPWSVINYFNNNCKPKAFWQFTGSNDIIGEILANADEDIYERLNMLMQGKSFLTYVDTGVIYPQIQNNPSTIYSFLLVAGYLKSLRSDSEFGSDYMCEVAIPNKEISFVYSKEILSKLDKIIPSSTAIAIQEAIYAGNSAALQKQLHKLLLQSASYHDTAHEIFYHGLVLGLCAMFDNRYDVTSNRESGEGRYDIQLEILRLILQTAQGLADRNLHVMTQAQVLGNQGGEGGDGTVSVRDRVEGFEGDVFSSVEDPVGAGFDLFPGHGDQTAGVGTDDGSGGCGHHGILEKVRTEARNNGGEALIDALHSLLEEDRVNVVLQCHGEAVDIGMGAPHQRQVENGGIVDGVGGLIHRYLAENDRCLPYHYI